LAGTIVITGRAKISGIAWLGKEKAEPFRPYQKGSSSPGKEGLPHKSFQAIIIT